MSLSRGLDWFVHRGASAGRTDTVRQHAFVLTQFGAVVAIVPVWLVLLFHEQNRAAGIVVVLVSVVFACLPFLSRLTGQWRLLGAVAVVWLNLSVLAGVYLFGGPMSPVLAASVIAPVMSMLFLTGTIRLVGIALAAVGLVALVLLMAAGHQFPRLISPDVVPPFHLATVVATICYLTAMTWMYVGVRVTAQAYLKDEVSRSRDIATLLQAQWHEARQTSHNKAQNLASIGEEFAIAIRSMIGFSQLISADTDDSPEADRYRACARDIESSGRHMLEILQAVEGLAKAETGELSLTLGDVDLTALVRGRIDDLHNLMEIGHLEIVCDLQDENICIKGDERRLRQAIGSVLSNAVRFNRRNGQIVVRLAKSNGQVVLAVADTGFGIAPETLKEVRERMDRARQRNSLEPGGGYGLQFATVLVALHGGTLELESVTDEGTRVTISLPA